VPAPSSYGIDSRRASSSKQNRIQTHYARQDWLVEDIEPITVAAYIETLQRHAPPPTVKQHMAAIRMLFSWLTEKGVPAMNPAREVKTEKFSRSEGKTPAFVEGEVQKLLDTVEPSTHTGLRDRALLGVLAYTFARIGAVVNLKVEDYYPSGKSMKCSHEHLS
jgi:site-specific recombinase XerD